MAQAFLMPTNDMLEQQHQTALLTRPEAKRMTQLEQEMANILSRTDLTERQKMELFSLTLQNFRRVQGEIINNGLMLTQTNGPSTTSDNTVFDKIHNLLQQAMADNTGGPSTPSSPRTPMSNRKLSAGVIKLRDQLLRQKNIYLDSVSNEYVVAGTSISPDVFHLALKTIISNKDINSADPTIRAATENIYKTLMSDGNLNPAQYARYKYFQGLATNFNKSPRGAQKRKRKTSRTPSYSINTTPKPRRVQAPKKRLQTGSGNSEIIIGNNSDNFGNVNFDLWDKQ